MGADFRLGIGSHPCAAQVLLSIIHGTVKKVDKATKTVVVKTADRTEHTIKVADQATVQGAKEGFHGLKEARRW